MEEDHHIQAGLVTLNVLLDIAIKSRRWTLIPALCSELDRRGLRPDRYTYSSLIYYAGLKMDGDEVRRLYRRMVEHGEVIDIRIINTVLGALVRAGEVEAAENIYERLKKRVKTAFQTAKLSESVDSHIALSHFISEDSDKRRAKVYQHMAAKNHEKLKSGQALNEEDVTPYSSYMPTPPSLQESLESTRADSQPLAPSTSPSDMVNFHRRAFLCPDTATLNLLLQYHCLKSGDFERICSILDDMQLFNIPDSQAMYQSLFEGFALHGQRKPSWTAARLDYIFSQLLGCVKEAQTQSPLYSKPENGPSLIKISQTLARTIIRAYTTMGSHTRLLTVWTQIDDLWQQQGGNVDKRSNNVMQELNAALEQLSQEQN